MLQVNSCGHRRFSDPVFRHNLSVDSTPRRHQHGRLPQVPEVVSVGTIQEDSAERGDIGAKFNQASWVDFSSCASSCVSGRARLTEIEMNRLRSMRSDGRSVFDLAL